MHAAQAEIVRAFMQAGETMRPGPETIEGIC
jgi:hypothetical protein